MVAVDTAPDTKDVSQFLSTLILTGNIEESVSRLYEHIPEVEREASVRSVIEGMYSQLPEPVAAQIQERQDLLTGRVTAEPKKSELRSGGEYTVFGDYKKILLFLFAFSFIVLGASYLVLHHQHRFLSRITSHSKAHAVATGS
jgi:hypothetical protein